MFTAPGNRSNILSIYVRAEHTVPVLRRAFQHLERRLNILTGDNDHEPAEFEQEVLEVDDDEDTDGYGSGLPPGQASQNLPSPEPEYPPGASTRPGANLDTSSIEATANLEHTAQAAARAALDTSKTVQNLNKSKMGNGQISFTSCEINKSNLQVMLI